MLSGTTDKNENKSTTEETNNLSSSVPSMYTLPTIRRKKPISVPEYTTKNVNNFFNSNIFYQAPVDVGLSVGWRAAIVIGVAYAILPVGLGLLNAIMPGLYAGGICGTLGAVGKFGYDHVQEFKKNKKGPTP